MADFSRITERLFVGAQIELPDWPTLAAAGVTHVIDAQAERVDTPATGMTVLWVPQQDDGVHPKPVEWFAKAVSFGLGVLCAPGTIVLTHCAAGVNRGPSLGYAILRAQGWSRDDAFALLKAKRPQVQVAYRDDADVALKTLGWTK